MTIQFLNCGGTIDKTYNPSKEMFEHTTTHWGEIFSRARISQEIEIKMEELFLKDSLDMSEKDFEHIVTTCTHSEYEKILIAHGTSKMQYVAQKLGERKLPKTIVLFGAMLPFELEQSDALFNFGVALAAAQIKGYGVYIAMNGKIFPWDAVKKDEENAVFVSQKEKFTP